MNSARNTNRPTKTTFKSFVKKNAANLLVKVNAEFDSMSDCVRTANGAWRMVDQSAIELDKPYTMGIEGVWLVGGGRDWFEHYETAAVIGIRGFNCCGSFTVAVAKQQHAANPHTPTPAGGVKPVEEMRDEQALQQKIRLGDTGDQCKLQRGFQPDPLPDLRRR